MRLDGLADATLLNQAAIDVRNSMRNGDAEAADVLRVCEAELVAARRRFAVDVESAVRAALREHATGTPLVRAGITLTGPGAAPAPQTGPGADWVFRLQSVHREAIRRRVLELANSGKSSADVVKQVLAEADAAAEIAGQAVVEHAAAIAAEEERGRQFIRDNRTTGVLRVRGLGFGA